MDVPPAHETSWLKPALDRSADCLASRKSLAQFAFEELAARIFRQALDEDDALWHLELRHSGSAVVDHGLLIQVLPALDDDNRCHGFDPSRIRQADDRHFRYG